MQATCIAATTASVPAADSPAVGLVPSVQASMLAILALAVAMLQ